MFVPRVRARVEEWHNADVPLKALRARQAKARFSDTVAPSCLREMMWSM